MTNQSNGSITNTDASDAEIVSPFLASLGEAI